MQLHPSYPCTSWVRCARLLAVRFVRVSSTGRSLCALAAPAPGHADHAVHPTVHDLSLRRACAWSSPEPDLSLSGLLGALGKCMRACSA